MEKSKKIGRPKAKDPKNKRVLAALTQSQYDLLKEYSEARSIPVSIIISRALQMYLEENF